MPQDQIDKWMEVLDNKVGKISKRDSIFQALDQRRNLSKVQNFLAERVDNRLSD